MCRVAAYYQVDKKVYLIGADPITVLYSRNKVHISTIELNILDEGVTTLKTKIDVIKPFVVSLYNIEKFCLQSIPYDEKVQ